MMTTVELLIYVITISLMLSFYDFFFIKEKIEEKRKKKTHHHNINHRSDKTHTYTTQIKSNQKSSFFLVK
jgi:biopolymer transport protein ExbB/TolQ